DIVVAIHSAKTSKFGNGNYQAHTPTFVNGPVTFRVTNYDIDRGVMRITVLGDWTNAGTVGAQLEIQKIHNSNRLGEQITVNRIFPGDNQVYTVEVPEGATVFETSLAWVQDWSTWPTNDLDVIVVAPDGRTYYQGATLDGPEFVRINNPVPGTYELHVIGYTIWKDIDGFRLGVQVTTPSQIYTGNATGEGNISLAPAEFALAPNFPNPFNPSTTIRYQLAREVPVRLEIFNIQGQRVRTLVHAVQSAGFYSVEWDGRNDAGQPVASGTYIYRLQAGSFVQTRQMTLMK
ncbi:MAG TPA: T9SS type A sorting domain-containing protein, partial [Calditrichae bacterium]|nr:T9SS type A sorting domain-containing protein [Calditrichia bacterium]